jgi:hypothetical protein
VLLGKWDSYDRDSQDERAREMGQGDFPAEKNEPENVKHEDYTPLSPGSLNDLFAKGSKGSHTELHGLETKGNPNDGQAKQNTANDVTQPGNQTAEDKPDDVAD